METILFIVISVLAYASMYFFLKKNQFGSNISVRNPLEYHRFGTPQEPAEHIWKEIPVQTNDVLVFPGWLKHKTQPNNTNEDRIVLSVNYESH